MEDGTSKEQIKLKLEVDVHLKIVAIEPGRGGAKNEGGAGAFTCASSDGQLRVDVTVKNEALRDQVDANGSDFIGRIIAMRANGSDFIGRIIAVRANGSDFIGRIIAVRANCVMKPGDSSPLHSLFLPRMVEASYRTDKTEPDSLEQVIAQSTPR